MKHSGSPCKWNWLVVSLCVLWPEGRGRQSWRTNQHASGWTDRSRFEIMLSVFQGSHCRHGSGIFFSFEFLIIPILCISLKSFPLRWPALMFICFSATSISPTLSQKRKKMRLPCHFLPPNLVIVLRILRILTHNKIMIVGARQVLKLSPCATLHCAPELCFFPWPQIFDGFLYDVYLITRYCSVGVFLLAFTLLDSFYLVLGEGY